MLNLRQLRRVLDLRLVDVSNATGIPEQKISFAERGLKRLSETEESLLLNFLRERASSVQCRELLDSSRAHDFAQV